jgi:hypothetical protein
MANEFKIVISAVDKATASVRRINDSISRITRPVADVRRSVAGLGREMGLGKVAASFGKVSKSAGAVAKSVRSIAAPIAAVAGIGSLASIAALATEWGRMGMEVSNTSRNLGIATSDLQSLRGAAQLAGVSSESLTGGMLSLGDTINDAKWGRNQGVVALMARLGMGFHMTQDGSVDTVRSLKDLSAAIGKIKSVETQHNVARQFGVEALLPLLRKGAKEIDAYQKKIAGLGGVQSAASMERAAQFGLQLNYLKAATDGLKLSIGEQLMPIMQPLVGKLTSWIAANRELIATRVSEFVKGFAAWLSKVNFNNVLKGITNIIRTIGRVVDAFGGWKNVILAVVGLKILSAVAPLIMLAAALASVGVSLGAIAAGTGGLAILAAVAAYAGYKGAEYLFGDKPAATRARGQSPAAHLRTKADLYAEANRQRIDAGLSPLAPRGLMTKDVLKAEARQQWIQTFGLPRGSGAAPLGIRSNNPLNLMPGGKEAVFPTVETGISAALQNLMGKRYFGGGNDTVAGIVNTWSPPNAAGNNPAKNANYIAGVEREVGSGHLDATDPQTMAKLLSAMIRQENGSAYDKPKMDDAVQRVVVEFKNAPAGMSASISGGSRTPTSVRVATAMPLTGMP